jgi:sigma-B regulation protein RsbU (phosphoserine phosphatase)
MDARLVDQVIGSPVFAKLILLACIAALFFYLRRKDTEGHSGAFLSLLGILLVRDLLSAYYFSPELFFISDVFYLGFALYIILAPFENSRFVLVFALVLNVLIAAIFLGIVILDVPVGIPGTVFGYLLVVDAALAGLGAFMNRKDRSNSSRHLVSLLWPLAVPFLLAYAVLAIILGYGDARFLDLVMPLSYGWLLAAALFSLGIQEAEMASALAYYEAAIDSLYSMFLSTGSALANGLSDHEVLKSLNEILVSGTGADGGIILMPEGADFMTLKVYAGFFPPVLPVPEQLQRTTRDIEQYMKQSRFYFSDGLFGEVGKAGKNVFCPRAAQDPRFAQNNADDFFRIDSFMAVPLMIEDRILGVAALVRTSSGAEFREADFDRFRLLVNFGSFAVSALIPGTRVVEKEASLQSVVKASPDYTYGELQKFILPGQLPRFPGLSADAMTASASGRSGVYYDLLQARKGKIIGVVAHTASLGLRSTMILAMLKAVLQVLARTDKDMASVLNWANRVLQGSIEENLTPSVGLICLNLQTMELEYANAGALGLLVYRHGTRTLDCISRESTPLGKVKPGGYERIRLQLHTGDMAVLYTAGVVDCADGQGNQFGRKALGRAIVAHVDSDATAVLEGIHSALSAFSGSGQAQAGQTVLVMKVE